MVSSYTTRIRLEKQGDGENPNSWGTVLNQNVIDLVDEAIAAYTTVVVSSADVTLTANDGTTDQSRSPFLELSGTVSASLNVLVPQKSKSYVINDKTTRQNSAAITLKTAAGTGSTVAAGSRKMFLCDTVSVFGLDYLTADTTTGFAKLSVANTFTEANTFNKAVAFASAVGFATSVSATNIFVTSIAANSMQVSSALFTADVCVNGPATFVSTATFSGQLVIPPVTLTDAASIALDLSTATTFFVSLAGNRTLGNGANAQPGQSGFIYVFQDGTGSRTLSYGDSYNFPDAEVPVLSTVASAVDMLVYNVRGVSAIDMILVSSFG